MELDELIKALTECRAKFGNIQAFVHLSAGDTARIAASIVSLGTIEIPGVGLALAIKPFDPNDPDVQVEGIALSDNRTQITGHLRRRTAGARIN